MMSNWNVTLINTEHPFDKKDVIVEAETVQQALLDAEDNNKPYYARAARYHHSTYGESYGYQQTQAV